MPLHIHLMTVVAAVLLPGMAMAQMNNQPFSFGSGSGVSTSVKRAIVDQKLQRRAPDNLLRDADGGLVTVRRGPGGVPIVGRSGQVRSQASRRKGFGPGEFNNFFVKFDGLPFRRDATSSGQMVDAWTGAVHGVVTVSDNSVDQWTAMVQYMK